MRHCATSELGTKYQDLFLVLKQAGFEVAVEQYSPESFGNFVVLASSPKASVQVINDRGQIFVDVKPAGGAWRDKEEVLETLGIPRSRHPTLDGLWTGYEPATQANELREYLSRVIDAVVDGAA